MGRMLVLAILILGGACPVQLPSSHLILTSTQTLYDSYLISCTASIPEERVTQVHWKERHPDGKYNMIAVLNTIWGNSTQFPYQLIVKLNKIDDTTYTLEMAGSVKVVCCEVVTYPSGIVQESCLTVESDSAGSEGGNVESALLGTLLVSGFFIFGSFVLICHICWTKKKSSRRIFNMRGTGQEMWDRSQRSQVPYARTPPSVNLAYEPPIEANLLNNEAAQRTHLHRTAPANQLTLEGPTRAPPNYQIPPSTNQWLSENTPTADLSSYINPFSFSPSTINVIPEHSTTGNQIYSNVRRHNKPHLRVTHLKNTQNEPVGEQHQPDTFPFAGSNQSSTGNAYYAASAPWLHGDTSYFSEEAAPLRPPRLRVPRTPDSPFTTINPMYHSRPAWAPQPSNAHYQHTTHS